MAAQTAADKLTKARANLVMGHPFFGSLALRLKMKEDPNMKEKAVCDGVTVRYNPAEIEKLSLSQTQGLLAGLVMHPAFLHHTRRGGRDLQKWNQACDYSINNILKDAKFDLPEDTYINPAYRGMTAEHIYTLLPPGPPSGGQSNQSGNSGSGQSQKQSGKGKGKNEKDSDGDGDGQNDNIDPGGNGGVEDSPNSQNQGASQSQQDHEESEWKVALAQAAHVAKQAGKLPSEIERMIEELLEPVLPWRSILRRFMTEKALDDFSWKRGNRRFLAHGLYLPSRESEGSGEIVVVIDTSGSIGERELTEFGSEIKAIIDDVRPKKTHVIYCDAAVNKVVTFAPEDDLVLEAVGGGGTDFRPPFKYVEDNGIEPKCLVYLTDGYGPFPEEEDVPYPTMWAINNHDVIPPFGEHLIMEV